MNMIWTLPRSCVRSKGVHQDTDYAIDDDDDDDDRDEAGTMITISRL